MATQQFGQYIYNVDANGNPYGQPGFVGGSVTGDASTANMVSNYNPTTGLYEITSGGPTPPPNYVSTPAGANAYPSGTPGSTGPVVQTTVGGGGTYNPANGGSYTGATGSQLGALNTQTNTPTSTNPATSPAIPPTNSNVSSQIGALNTGATPTTNNGVGNSTSGSQLPPGQTSASLGAIMQQLPQTPQDQQRQALTNPNNITGYQNLNQGSGV